MNTPLTSSAVRVVKRSQNPSPWLRQGPVRLRITRWEQVGFIPALTQTGKAFPEAEWLNPLKKKLT